jgi:hypothetical protein
MEVQIGCGKNRGIRRAEVDEQLASRSDVVPDIVI